MRNFQDQHSESTSKNETCHSNLAYLEFMNCFEIFREFDK